MKKILVINGHPVSGSYCEALKNAYCAGAEKAGAEVSQINIADLNFDPVLHYGYKIIQPLEEDLIQAQRSIEEADHIMIIFPVWWGGVPAVLKGFLDRTFVPTWAFSFPKGGCFQKKLLSGRSARIMMTMDNYPVIFRIFFGAPALRQIRDMTLKFCGIRPVKVNMMGSVRFSSERKREKWLLNAGKCGRRDALK